MNYFEEYERQKIDRDFLWSKVRFTYSKEFSDKLKDQIWIALKIEIEKLDDEGIAIFINLIKDTPAYPIFIAIMENKGHRYQINWIDAYISLRYPLRNPWSQVYRGDLDQKFHCIMIQYFPRESPK